MLPFSTAGSVSSHVSTRLWEEEDNSEENGPRGNGQEPECRWPAPSNQQQATDEGCNTGRCVETRVFVSSETLFNDSGRVSSQDGHETNVFSSFSRSGNVPEHSI